MKAKMALPNFDKLIKEMQIKAEALPALAYDAVKIGQDIQFEEMKKGLERHIAPAGKGYGKGDALKALIKDPIKQEGNVISTKTGTDKKANEKGFFDAQYQEFGVGPINEEGRSKKQDTHIKKVKLSGKAYRPRFIKDPWFRPAIDNTAPVRAAWKKLLKERGYL